MKRTQSIKDEQFYQQGKRMFSILQGIQNFCPRLVPRGSVELEDLCAIFYQIGISATLDVSELVGKGKM